MIRAAAVVAALLLSGCGLQATGPAPTQYITMGPPITAEERVDSEARTEGNLRGTELRIAKACGADPKRWAEESRRSTVPVSYTPRQSGAYSAALASAISTGRQPGTAECNLSRANLAYAALFPGGSVAVAAPAAALPLHRGPDQPSYCAGGTAALEASSSLTANLDAIAARCRPGDSIIIPFEATGVIASACDLSKPVATAGRNVFCTVGRIKPMRNSGS